MPIYEYGCPNGHERVETIRSYERRDDAPACPTCGGPMFRAWSVSHVPPDGVYSYAPNVGDPERFERQRQAIKDGVKVIERTPTKQQREQMERNAEQAYKRSRR